MKDRIATRSSPLRRSIDDASNSEPLRSVVDGIAMVTIPATAYVELLAKASSLPAMAAARAKVRGAGRPRRRARLPSTIERDPEVAEFLRGRFALADALQAAHAACLNRFGADRTPSVSRICQFRLRVREGA